MVDSKIVLSAYFVKYSVPRLLYSFIGLTWPHSPFSGVSESAGFLYFILLLYIILHNCWPYWCSNSGQHRQPPPLQYSVFTVAVIWICVLRTLAVYVFGFNIGSTIWVLVQLFLLAFFHGTILYSGLTTVRGNCGLDLRFSLQ
jgi:hypothetical protein